MYNMYNICNGNYNNINYNNLVCITRKENYFEYKKWDGIFVHYRSK